MKKRWLVYALLLLLSVGLFGRAGGGATTVPLPPSDALCGSYIAGVADAQRLFSVDASQVFLLRGPKNGRFVRGRVAPPGEGLTWSPARIPTTRGSSLTRNSSMTATGFP